MERERQREIFFFFLSLLFSRITNPLGKQRETDGAVSSMSPAPPRSEGGGENTVPVELEPERGDEAARANAALPTTTTANPSSSSLPQQQRHRVAIVWFRRDLRVSDNPALMAAAAEADYVVRENSEFFIIGNEH